MNKYTICFNDTYISISCVNIRLIIDRKEEIITFTINKNTYPIRFVNLDNIFSIVNKNKTELITLIKILLEKYNIAECQYILNKYNNQNKFRSFYNKDINSFKSTISLY